MIINLDSFFKSLILHPYFKCQENFIQICARTRQTNYVINTYFISGYMTGLLSLVYLSLLVMQIAMFGQDVYG